MHGSKWRFVVNQDATSRTWSTVGRVKRVRGERDFKNIELAVRARTQRYVLDTACRLLHIKTCKHACLHCKFSCYFPTCLRCSDENAPFRYEKDHVVMSWMHTTKRITWRLKQFNSTFGFHQLFLSAPLPPWQGKSGRSTQKSVPCLVGEAGI